MMQCAAEEPSTHGNADHSWALVLAAGEGSRLQALTTNASGIPVPKQFCSLGGGSSLLQDALQRVACIAPRQRTCVVVAAQHRRWWEELSATLPTQNIIVQPRNRGTANGILLPLLRILQRDPDASLLVLPSDHYVRDEAVLATGLQQALQVSWRSNRIVLAGFAPEAPDPELGYIVPSGEGTAGAVDVREFVEKPCESAARQLTSRGGLWNSFIFAARGRTLLRLFEQRCPEIVMEMRGLVATADAGMRPDPNLIEMYERLPVLDFSRDILERCASQLQVLRVPPCGWSDLGTPVRVAQVLGNNGPKHHARTPRPADAGGGFLSLAAQYAKFLAAQACVEATGDTR